MITKQAIDYIISICKQYIDDVLRGWGLSKEEKELVAFEKEHMPYTRYSGNQSIDHVLFRKFLRIFNPDAIREAAKADLDKKQDKEDKNLNTTIKTVVGAINELRDTIGVSGGGGTKEVIEVENEDALNDIEEPSKEVIYITADTEQLYIYDGDKFINVTNKQVDNTIYVYKDTDLIDDKDKYSAGVYTVVNGIGNIYNLSVDKSGTLRLYNHKGWANVETGLNGQYWKWHYYTYQENIDALLPLIYAGL